MKKLIVAVPVLIFLCAPAQGALQTFTDLGTYNAAVGAHTVIDFTGLAIGTVLSNQYAGLGATFVDGNDTVDTFIGYTDGRGYGDNGSSTIDFSSPMNHFGVEFPGAVEIRLYNGGSLLSSSQFGGAGTGFFGGVLDSGQTFDRVVLLDWYWAPGYYDNIHFGNASSVPEPTTLAIWSAFGGLGMMVAARRRRRIA